jgi:hypothetical protein
MSEGSESHSDEESSPPRRRVQGRVPALPDPLLKRPATRGQQWPEATDQLLRLLMDGIPAPSWKAVAEEMSHLSLVSRRPEASETRWCRCGRKVRVPRANPARPRSRVRPPVTLGRAG